jgi:hypothetical protein
MTSGESMKRTNMTKMAAVLIGMLTAACSTASTGKTPDEPADSGPGAADTAPAAADTGPSYPSGPYGVTVGKVLDPTLEWQGFAPNATTPSTVKITDLWDPDGSKGINAVVIDSSGQWCIACQGIAKLIPGWFSPKGDDWAKLGVQMITLVIQNNNYEPATVTTAQQWRALFSLNELYVVADPADTFPTNALPSQLLVNPRTMKVVRDLSNDTAQTADGADPQVATLAMKNGGKK